MYSSPGAIPSSVTSARRSVSGSMANPISAPVCFTCAHRSATFSGIGSRTMCELTGRFEIDPVHLTPRGALKRPVQIAPPTPFTASTTTVYPLLRIRLSSMISRSSIASICSLSAPSHSVNVPVKAHEPISSTVSNTLTTSCPCDAVRNIPSGPRNLRPFPLARDCDSR